MTIDLGYSFYETPDGLRVGIIDVPGHERFVKNMVAGTTSMHLVILVVAADDGVMPQTREHLSIMTLLGIRRGIVALTKTDLVDEEMVELAAEDIRDLVKETFLEEAPIMPLSTLSGEGFDRFRRTLDMLIKETVPVEPAGLFRMPVQRVFSMKGFGTVATGVPVSGVVRTGDPVEILPSGQRGKVRGIQAYGVSCREGSAGHRTALNITDVDYRSFSRGHVIVSPDSFSTTGYVEAALTLLKGPSFPLKNMAEVRVHTGTSEVMARIILLDRKVLEPGGEALVQLKLESSLVVVPGDRFILRLHSPMITIGGGTIVGTTEIKLKRFKDHILRRVSAKRDSLGDFNSRVLVEAEAWRGDFITSRDLALSLNVSVNRVSEAVDSLKSEGRLIEVKPGLFMCRDRFERLADKVIVLLDEQHGLRPLLPYVDLKLLRQGVGLEGPAFMGMLAVMEEKGLVESARGGLIRRAGFAPRPTDRQRGFIDRITKGAEESAVNPPSIEEILEREDLPREEAESGIAFLLDTGELVKVGSFLFHKNVLDRVCEAVKEVAREHGEVLIPLLRDRFETSRKYMIPLMEYLDEIGLTKRKGDKRYLKSDHSE